MSIPARACSPGSHTIHAVDLLHTVASFALYTLFNCAKTLCMYLFLSLMGLVRLDERQVATAAMRVLTELVGRG